MDTFDVIEKYDGIASTLLCGVMLYHLWKCEKRSDEVWDKLNELSREVYVLIGREEKK